MPIDSDALYLDLDTGKAKVRKGAVWIPVERVLADPDSSEELKRQVREALRLCGLDETCRREAKEEPCKQE